MKRILSAIWRGLKGVVKFARRRPAIFWGIVVVVQFLCILQLGGKLDERKMAEAAIPQSVVQDQSAQQPMATVMPTLPSAPAVPIGQYDIVVVAGGKSPKGQLSYSTPYTCGGGCGSFNGTIELRGIRVDGQEFVVLDLDIVILEVNGDPWLFEGNLGDIVLEINGQSYVPISSSFQSQVTGPATLSGFLTFVGQIALADPNPQYQITMRMPSRLAQPLEGWLMPHQ